MTHRVQDIEYRAPPQRNRVGQMNQDRIHADLPIAMQLDCKLDDAGPPVMRPGRSGRKMRRGGLRAALLQRHHPVDDCETLHGPSGMAGVEEPEAVAHIRAPCRSTRDVRRWVRWCDSEASRRWQGKSRKVRPVGRGRNQQKIQITLQTLPMSSKLCDFRQRAIFVQLSTPCGADDGR